MNYYILLENEPKGPYTISQLRSLWNSGSITGNTLYCQEEFTEWVPLAGIPVPSLDRKKDTLLSRTLSSFGSLNIKLKLIILAATAWMCFIFIVAINDNNGGRNLPSVPLTNPSVGNNSSANSQYENANNRDHYTPTEFINKFGGSIASDVKDVLGPPDEVSGNEWCYHNIINNPDTEKLDDVWIDFEQKPDYPIVVIQVVAIRVSGNTYTWQQSW
jgi:hypothetical protein